MLSVDFVISLISKYDLNKALNSSTQFRGYIKNLEMVRNTHCKKNKQKNFKEHKETISTYKLQQAIMPFYPVGAVVT